MTAPSTLVVDPDGLPDPELWTLDRDTILCRIYFTAGDYVLPWNGLRTYGPADGRFDPHPLPAQLHPPEHGVLYAAADLGTAMAEVFQRTRVVDRTFNAPYVARFHLSRPVHLLDLTGSWPLRAGYTSGEISSGDRRVSRAWARACHRRWTELAGVRYRAKTNGQLCVALWGPAAEALATAQARSNDPLNHPDLADEVYSSCYHLGFRVL